MNGQNFEWLRKTSIYQINPRTFSKEGTISAVTKELPCLAKLGFGAMYLCPIFKADASENRDNWSRRQLASQTDNPKNPYRMDDYFAIDSEYGTMDDLKELVNKSHELGMRVILDLVYLHIGPNAEVFRNYPEFAAKNADGSVKLTYWNFPYLNYESEGLKEYLWCNMTYYVGVIGVDGFRCDVGDDVPLEFWREGARRIRAIKPDAVMINEGQKPEAYTVFNANYGFSWHENFYKLLHGEITASAIVDEYNDKRSKYPEGALILRDMENHDTVTDWPHRVEEHFGNDCMEAVLATNYALDGVPMVYCGNELADTAKLSMFANRFHMGKFEATDRNASGKAVDRRKQVIKALNVLKSENGALQNGKTEWLDLGNDYVLAFKRRCEGEEITFIGNFSNEELRVTEGVNGQILLSNNAKAKGGRLDLSKYGYAIIKS